MDSYQIINGNLVYFIEEFKIIKHYEYNCVVWTFIADKVNVKVKIYYRYIVGLNVMYMWGKRSTRRWRVLFSSLWDGCDPLTPPPHSPKKFQEIFDKMRKMGFF